MSSEASAKEAEEGAAANTSSNGLDQQAAANTIKENNSNGKKKKATKKKGSKKAAASSSKDTQLQQLAFSIFDADADGHISLQELENILKSVGNHLFLHHLGGGVGLCFVSLSQ